MLELDHKLAALRHLHLNSAVVLNDPAVWCGLAVGAAAAVAAAFVLGRTIWRRHALRREAEAALARTDGLPPDERLVEQARLLRRLARTCGDQGTAALQGEAWLAALDRLFQTTFFTRGAGRCFAHDLYARTVPDPDPRTTAELRLLLARLRG